MKNAKKEATQAEEDRQVEAARLKEKILPSKLLKISSDSSAPGSSESSSTSNPQVAVSADEPASEAGPHPIFALGAIPCSSTPDELLLIRVRYGVPPEYDLELPGPSDRASTPPPGRFCLYQEVFRAGLRLPLPVFVAAFFRFLDISLASVAPNSFRFLIGFLSLCHIAEVQPSLSLFRHFYTFKRHPSVKDWWYFSPQFGKKGLLKGAPSSIYNWKEKFLFVHCPTLELGLPPWGSLRDFVRRAPSLGEDDLQAAQKLLTYPAPSLPNLLREQLLFNIGLSPQDPATMDAEATRMLAKGMRAQKRKGATASGSAKRARAEETSLVAPVQAVPAIDIPSDAEPVAPRASSRSPPTGAPALGVRPMEAPAAGRRRKSVARRASSHRAAADESVCSEGGSENPFNDKDLIRRLLDGCILSDVVERIDRVDPEQRAWDSLGSFLEIGHQLFAYVEATSRMRRDLLQAEERRQAKVACLQAKTAEVATLQEALERERQAREEERQAREEERWILEESARKAEAEVAHLVEQTPVLVLEARALAVEEFKASAEMRELNVQFGQEAFTKGFELCQEKVASRFPDLDLGFLEESEDEAGPSSAATAVAPPTPSSPPPAPEV
ncbi:uncharacterized protein [Elaeis guineensis]|uniref:uncharacterized protein n=1 Tax=Elaeis guineensis var. tenera TaxID=51953 RepID=UPI003C6CD0D0